MHCVLMQVKSIMVHLFQQFLILRFRSDSMEQKKDNAVTGLQKLIKRLTDEQISLKNENKGNEELGRQVTIRVMQSAAPNECDKYKLHVEETDKITSLLLGLTGRLARAENCLRAAENDSNEKVRNIFPQSLSLQRSLIEHH